MWGRGYETCQRRMQPRYFGSDSSGSFHHRFNPQSRTKSVLVNHEASFVLDSRKCHLHLMWTNTANVL